MVMTSLSESFYMTDTKCAELMLVGINLEYRESSVVSSLKDILTPRTSKGYAYYPSGLRPEAGG